MMTISKEQWKAIQTRLKAFMVHLEFSLNGHAITIQRVRKSENTTALAVYIDHKIKGDWVGRIDEISPDDAFINCVVKQVWHHRFVASYNRKEIQQLEKVKKRIGVKRFKELYSTTDPKTLGFTYLTPYFGSAAVLMRQFKKIDGLQLVTELQEVADETQPLSPQLS
ncbi:MAG: hypothetical protein ACRC53_08320 [Plesiomonas sp.]|uniref:hypothetical protein n=1 Tax=Plesiomonas sp. TaxID=2486279 RepID=UPI003F31F3A8